MGKDMDGKGRECSLYSFIVGADESGSLSGREAGARRKMSLQAPRAD